MHCQGIYSMTAWNHQISQSFTIIISASVCLESCLNGHTTFTGTLNPFGTDATLTDSMDRSRSWLLEALFFKAKASTLWHS